jgi:hypothetical protein
VRHSGAAAFADDDPEIRESASAVIEATTTDRACIRRG